MVAKVLRCKDLHVSLFRNKEFEERVGRIADVIPLGFLSGQYTIPVCTFPYSHSFCLIQGLLNYHLPTSGVGGMGCILRRFALGRDSHATS